jgi:hypothetical protein
VESKVLDPLVFVPVVTQLVAQERPLDMRSSRKERSDLAKASVTRSK